MISRRSVRVKVMQAIYSYECSEDALPATFLKRLQSNINSVNNLYLFILLVIREIADEVRVNHEIKSSKYLPTEEDLTYSTKLLSNPFILRLNNDEVFKKELRKSGVFQFLSKEMIQQLYETMYQSPEYQNYTTSGLEFDESESRDIVKFILNNVMLSDEAFFEYIEECFPSWEDDAEMVVMAVRELIHKSGKSFQLHTVKPVVQGKMLELREFGEKLFGKVISLKELHTMEIENYLKNWEVERIAVLDLILIRMGLTEFTDFPSIPVKVTMNEYIEISKSYSSPKSKDFVNGILDRMHRDMREKDLIVKTGRGLKEN